MPEIPEGTKVYFNKPQLIAHLVSAREEYHVAGRGTGKTSGIQAPRLRRNLISMPQSAGVMIAPTYQQMLTRTLPSMKAGLARLGIVEGIHYLIGQKPEKRRGWKLPFEAPDSFKYFISFCNGSGVHLVSQDIKGAGNGLNTDWIIGDEVKYLDYERFMEETFLTMRANRTRFGKYYYHKSLCFTTSMPTAAGSKWILGKEKDMDPDLVQLILNLAMQQVGLEHQLLHTAKSYKPALQRKILAIDAELNELRKDCVYYSEANTLDNIHVLGEDYIKKARRILPDFLFDTEIMNIRPDKIEGGFYPTLDLEKHTYTPKKNSDYLETLDYVTTKPEDIDCRQDGDIDLEKPLWIGVDWGSRINCMTIAQDFPHVLRFINAMHVLEPEYLDHLAHKFCTYYKPHKNKVVYFTYGHDGGTRKANTPLTYAKQFTAILERAGWRVIPRAKTMVPDHAFRYILNAKVLDAKENKYKPVSFNKPNCHDLLVSMLHAPAIDGGREGIRKNKNSEKPNSNVAPQDATHYSDTFDLIIDALYSTVIHERPGFLDTVVGS